MDSTIIVLLTIASLTFISLVFTLGYHLGKKIGINQGYDKAIKDLLITKNPEAWEFARYLYIDFTNAPTEKITKTKEH